MYVRVSCKYVYVYRDIYFKELAHNIKERENSAGFIACKGPRMARECPKDIRRSIFTLYENMLSKFTDLLSTFNTLTQKNVIIMFE